MREAGCRAAFQFQGLGCWALDLKPTMYTCLYVCMCACMSICVCMYVCMYVRMYVCSVYVYTVYMPTYIHTYMHAYIHANFREVPELPEEIVASVFGLYEFRVQALWSKELQIKKGQTREADNGCGPLHPILLALLARCSAGLGTSCRHMVSGPTK